jgi:hypothetical protein
VNLLFLLLLLGVLHVEALAAQGHVGFVPADQLDRLNEASSEGEVRICTAYLANGSQLFDFFRLGYEVDDVFEASSQESAVQG